MNIKINLAILIAFIGIFLLCAWPCGGVSAMLNDAIQPDRMASAKNHIIIALEDIEKAREEKRNEKKAEEIIERLMNESW